MENYYRRFPDWNSFLRFALQRSDSRNKTSRQMHDLDWFGGVTWKEAWELATHGWKEGAEKIKHYRTEIFNLLSEHIPTQSVVNATTGYAVNVGAYLSNDPECFIYRELNTHLTGHADGAVYCYVKTAGEYCTDYGKVNCGIAHLEAAGYVQENILLTQFKAHTLFKNSQQHVHTAHVKAYGTALRSTIDRSACQRLNLDQERTNALNGAGN